jgi:uncharacterized coiled-coil DUF342 family protein
MATPIKQVPILYGEEAEAFERMAREREKNPQGKPLTPEQEAKIAKMVKQLHEYKFPWDND